MCKFRDITGAVSAAIDVFTNDERLDNQLRRDYIRLLSWDLTDRICGSLREEELSRAQIDQMSIVVLDRYLGYNAEMFEDVAAIIESAVATDNLPMGDNLKRRLASWRKLITYQAQAKAEAEAPAKPNKPAAKKPASRKPAAKQQMAEDDVGVKSTVARRTPGARARFAERAGGQLGHKTAARAANNDQAAAAAA